jgi:hypothetical protein
LPVASMSWPLNLIWRILAWCITSWDLRCDRELMRSSQVMGSTQLRSWGDLGYWTISPWLHHWWWIWRSWVRLLSIQNWLIRPYTSSWLDHWDIFQHLDSSSSVSISEESKICNRSCTWESFKWQHEFNDSINAQIY